MLRIMIALFSVGLIAATVTNCTSECSVDKDCEEVVCADGTKHRSCQEGVCMTFSDCTTKQTGW